MEAKGRDEPQVWPSESACSALWPVSTFMSPITTTPAVASSSFLTKISSMRAMIVFAPSICTSSGDLCEPCATNKSACGRSADGSAYLSQDALVVEVGVEEVERMGAARLLLSDRFESTPSAHSAACVQIHTTMSVTSLRLVTYTGFMRTRSVPRLGPRCMGRL
jgi:hypothetical protein